MKSVLSIIFVLYSFFQLYGQETFFIGDKTYPCTKQFSLRSNSELDFTNRDILFARNGDICILAITLNYTSTTRITGKLYIYLDDNTMITCVDRNKFDIVDERATTLYYLNKQEIERLKIHNIQSIRYTEKCIDCVYPLTGEDYSVSNVDRTIGMIKESRINFPLEIGKLFIN